ncbi:uncharacterized protein I303_105731 [Kwoniella dejecticola CBS 10117]|uniref:Uncharacterized protein n=1 Tax=Kwoniella dejecticola CBS 10117 TaxID=1296121 RepID=A0A1A6A088_9TREE|nr:uncharacterized protein I303_05753 [Kwoniella dejecticola CBS 10117]OBR83474.1 hypothetical protein I303_05753 [Kwoniella dejecticola CBS 10117]
MGLLSKKSHGYDTTTTGPGHTGPNPYTTGSGSGVGGTGTGPHPQGAYDHNEGPLGHHTGQGVSGTGPALGGGGEGGTAGGVGVHPPPVAGAGHVNTGPAPLHGTGTGTAPSAKEALKLEKKGHREEKLGGILHSTSMQQKGAAHLAEADHLKMQASELSEAQRLEHEAGMRRQRAVGLGADPMHAHGQTGHGPNTHL